MLRFCQSSVAKESLRLLDRLPALFEWRQVPSRARATHHPEAALLTIEGETTTYREVLNDVVAAEDAIAERAG
jgi:hypothetical protein